MVHTQWGTTRPLKGKKLTYASPQMNLEPETSDKHCDSTHIRDPEQSNSETTQNGGCQGLKGEGNTELVLMDGGFQSCKMKKFWR